MLDSRLPKVMSFGKVKGSNPPGRPRKIWNDIVLSDLQQLNIKRLTVTLRTSQSGEAGLGPHTPSTCARMCNLLLLLLL